MIRTLLGVGALIATVLWLPLWFQLMLFVVGILVLPYRLLLLIPAVVADVVYAPEYTLGIAHLKMTLIVALLLLVQYVVVTHTRFTHHVSH